MSLLQTFHQDFNFTSFNYIRHCIEPQLCIKSWHISALYPESFFYVHVTVHRVKFLIIKPSRCTDFSNLFLEWNSTCFGQFLCTSSGVFHCTHSNGICHTGLLTACTRVSSWSCSQAVCKPVWHTPLLCVQWKTPDDGQRNCPKHVEFHSKNKFEKSVNPVGFIIRNSESCLKRLLCFDVICALLIPGP